jgi:hypothetical protein
MKKNLSHSILSGLCSVKNQSNSLKGNENPITPRVSFIVDTILDLGIYEGLNLDIFDDVSNLKYVNIELGINIGAENSVIYVAHHDVNNINSDNCQDNSASVSNLLSLAKHFSNNKPTDKNVYIVFTDCEEFGGLGAIQLSKRINEGVFGNVEYVVNLELTANGTNFWNDSKNFKNDSLLLDKLNSITKFTSVRTPFNDSVIFRKNNIDSVCIGSLTDKDLKQVLGRGFCQTWALCHKKEDKFENSNANDMDKFIELLTKTI